MTSFKKILASAATGVIGIVLIQSSVSAIPIPLDPVVPPLKILVVGDSISVGCETTPLDGWCKEFSGILTERNIQHQISGHVTSGYSCTQLVSGFAAKVDQFQPNLVIMACGTNDVPYTQADKDRMGTSWRTMVEYSHVRGAMVLPVFVQYSNAEIAYKHGWYHLLPGEGVANDVIYSNIQYYVNTPGWFAGLADLQKIPGNWDYIKPWPDGIHPNALGNKVMAKVFYRSLRGNYSWPDTVQEPCGMWGHRDIYQPYPYAPCENPQ